MVSISAIYLYDRLSGNRVLGSAKWVLSEWSVTLKLRFRREISIDGLPVTRVQPLEA